MSSLRDARLTLEEVRKIYEASQTTTFDTAEKLVDAQLRKALWFFDTWAEERCKEEYVEGDAHQENLAEAYALVAAAWRGTLEAEGIEPWEEE